MNLDTLLELLGYSDSSNEHWIKPGKADPRLAHHYRLAQRAGEEAGNGAEVVGSYVYQTSIDNKLTPPRPAVFVAHASNEEQAREIHKSLWNLGDCPFLIVVLDSTVRVYTGFNYDSHDTRCGIIAEIQNVLRETLFDISSLPEQLISFHAEAIDSGRIWKEQAKYLGSDTRVDYRLLANLKDLSQILQKQYGLSREVSHALIGKYIYLRYLRDRAILDDTWLNNHKIHPEDVFGRKATAEGFEALVKLLQKQFNGDIFPLPSNDDGQWRNDAAIRFLASIFHGDSTSGQLVLDFGIYDFSYIPVELLSSVYEQFLKNEEDKRREPGKKDGVVYTPEALADYVLAELEAVSPLSLHHKVLDPCCGSGIFLVLAYRRLIELLWRKQGYRPSAEEMKRLLQDNIFGVEKDREACQITSFSLILTLLSHLEPPELHANLDFQFPRLLGSNIFHADFFDDNCPVFKKEMYFDWVMGNPPWIGADKKNESHKYVLKWIKENATLGRVVGEKHVDEAFTWRAGEVLKETGYVGILVVATSLVKSSSAGYRKSFFNKFHVKRITNLANLRYLLFVSPKGHRAKAAPVCIIYRKNELISHKESILHFGPFVVNQLPLSTQGLKKRAWTIGIYEGDIQKIDYNEAIEDIPCLWKTALWGGYQDRRALHRLRKVLPKTIGDIIVEHKWEFGTGPHVKELVGNRKEKLTPVPSFGDKNILYTKDLNSFFFIPDNILKPISPNRQFIRSGQSTMGLMFAPHILINANYALYSDKDFVIAQPKLGIASRKEDAEYLKALTLYLNSTVARYALFFHSPLWGISIATISPENLKAVPFRDLLPNEIKTLSKAFDEFVEKERIYLIENPTQKQDPFSARQDVDEVVEKIFNIPESISAIAREFFRIRFQLNEGKIGTTIRLQPITQQLNEYGTQLRLQVDNFTQRHHQISIQTGQDAIIATIEVTNEKRVLPIIISENENPAVKKLLDSVRKRHSQWAYVQRSIRIFEGTRVHIIKAARLLDWTRLQAIQDATDLIADVLDQTGPHYEPTTA